MLNHVFYITRLSDCPPALSHLPSVLLSQQDQKGRLAAIKRETAGQYCALIAVPQLAVAGREGRDGPTFTVFSPGCKRKIPVPNIRLNSAACKPSREVGCQNKWAIGFFWVLFEESWCPTRGSLQDSEVFWQAGVSGQRFCTCAWRFWFLDRVFSAC